MKFELLKKEFEKFCADNGVVDAMIIFTSPTDDDPETVTVSSFSVTGEGSPVIDVFKKIRRVIVVKGFWGS